MIYTNIHFQPLPLPLPLLCLSSHPCPAPLLPLFCLSSVYSYLMFLLALPPPPYREAVEHFVTALHFQRSASMGGAGRETGSMSDTIWSTLRLALIYLDKQHLLRSVNERDLDTLMEHFNIEQ